MNSPETDSIQSACFDLSYVRSVNSNQDDKTKVDEEETINIETPNDLQSIVSTTNEKIDKLGENISSIVDKKLVSRGVWDPESKHVIVIDNKNLKQYTPHFASGKHFLYPFEALFAMECRALSITYENIPICIEDGYKFLLNGKRDFMLYRVFSTLSKSGYYVRSCTPKDEQIKVTVHDTNRKHLLDNENELFGEEIESTKKPKVSTSNDVKIQSNDNYKVMTSIRPLSMTHLRKLSRIDRKLQACCHSDEKVHSIVYCLRDSALPVEVNKRLQSLHGADQTLKPLIQLSSILNSEQLFQTMQQAGPKIRRISQSEPSAISDQSNIGIDFEVFRSAKTTSPNSVPLFRVAIVSDNDSLPSFAQLKRLQANCSIPILFAFVSNSLEFNFYGLEELTIRDEYPTLWETYYA